MFRVPFSAYQLQEPYLLGCLNERNDLSLISAGQSRDNLDCRMLDVNDMRPSERAQIIAGLPSGSLDNAIGQIEELAPQLGAADLSDPHPAPADTDRCAASARRPVRGITQSRTGNADRPEQHGAEPDPGTASRAGSRDPHHRDGSPPSPTATALPPPPSQPGKTCRTVS